MNRGPSDKKASAKASPPWGTHSKKVLNFMMTIADPKKTRERKVPSLMPIRVKIPSYLLCFETFSMRTW